MNSLTKDQKQSANDNQLTANRPFISPPVDITETKEGYVLEAEMPGVSKNGLEILLEGNELTFTGRRQPDQIKADLIYRESSGRDYRRAFVLDPSLDTQKIEARIENGVLTLYLPKAERVRPRRVTVTD